MGNRRKEEAKEGRGVWKREKGGDYKEGRRRTTTGGKKV